jgi:hypothetical protein
VLKNTQILDKDKKRYWMLDKRLSQKVNGVGERAGNQIF